jgi:hypothetical protein
MKYEYFSKVLKKKYFQVFLKKHYKNTKAWKLAFVSSIFEYFLKSPKKCKIHVCLNRIESMSLLWSILFYVACFLASWFISRYAKMETKRRHKFFAWIHSTFISLDFCYESIVHIYNTPLCIIFQSVFMFLL